jgi:hypothetical protein
MGATLPPKENNLFKLVVVSPPDSGMRLLLTELPELCVSERASDHALHILKSADCLSCQ